MKPSEPALPPPARCRSRGVGGVLNNALAWMVMEGLARKTRRPDEQQILFDDGADWHDHWWGMPSFDMKDCRPMRRVSINFMTLEDMRSFSEVTGIKLTERSDTAWYPPQDVLRGEFYYDGPMTDSRYPICIPSKGRADCQKTGKALDIMGVGYRFFVEETEYETYCEQLGQENVVKLPFHDLGQGSIPARNFIWEWAKERGNKRHWTVDDNIVSFYRCTNNRRLQVYGGGYFQAMEDFVDRYENVVMCGPHDIAFVGDRSPSQTPFLLNSRVYSCILLDTSLPYRWRGLYNEDTDLSLRLLKKGYCTMLFRALCMDKPATAGAVEKALKGGNTDNVYNTDDRRLAFAESLRDLHPDCVKVVWKFNRWHHQVDYSLFAKNKLRIRDGVTPVPEVNDYGMVLTKNPGRGFFEPEPLTTRSEHGNTTTQEDRAAAG